MERGLAVGEVRGLTFRAEPLLDDTGDNSLDTASLFASPVGEDGAECDSEVLSGDLSVGGRRGCGWA